MALRPSAAGSGPSLGERVRAWREARVGAARGELAQARLDLRPETYLLISIAAPAVLGFAGLALSLPMALLGAGAGAFVPRVYVRYLVGGEARAADDEAPRVLRAMVNRAAAGGTYPDLFAAAAEVARHRWVKADFEELLGRYYANEPLAEALAAIRPRQAGRNLALVFDALTVLAVTHQPASAAAGVLGALNEAARSNQAIARSAAAESRGLRVQALILAVVIPAPVRLPAGREPRARRAGRGHDLRAPGAAARRRAARGRGRRPVLARDAPRGVGDGPHPPRRPGRRPRRLQPADGGLRALAGGAGARRRRAGRGPAARALRAARVGRAPGLGAPPGAGRGLGRARVPALASQVSERDIVRAGLDPAALPPAEVYAAKLVLGVAILAVGFALSPFVPIALVAALPVAFAGYVFPTEYLGWLGRRRQGRLRRELPDFLALVRPLAERHALERAFSDVADALHRATGGRNLLAEQVRAAVAAYGTGVDLYAALRDVAAAADLEELDELAGSLAQARHLGKGVGDVLAEHERGLRDGERNRLAGRRLDRPAQARGHPRRRVPARVRAADRGAPVPLNARTTVKGGETMRQRLADSARRGWVLLRRGWTTFLADECGLTTLEYVIAAGIILVVLSAAILAWNNGLATKIGDLVRQLTSG